MPLENYADFLVEIGTEELPPTALKELRDSFAQNLALALERERLSHDAMHAYASPRRLAVRVDALAVAQPEREREQKGPPVSVAFDADGKPTAAARAFADKCGVEVSALERSKSVKGEWLFCRVLEKGRTAASLLPQMVQDALDKLPIPRRMRWGAVDFEFVRPVHWVLMLHGDTPVEGSVFGIPADRVSRGHRFLSSGNIRVDRPTDYPAVLQQQGFVLAGFAERRAKIVEEVREAAAEAGGTPVGDEALYDEVTALTEWPVAMTGRFNKAFLALPREVIVATLTGHQRYFPIVGATGGLLARFVLVANLTSKEPDRVREGNERVIRPRLADAAFFWEQDLKKSLESRRTQLSRVVYQKGLGSLSDKSDRMAQIAVAVAKQTAADASYAERAALLSKCDLLTGMVGEFPELQGVMGGYYARASGEPDAVADAIAEQYRPRFAGDTLPQTTTGRILALADKLDTLAGSFVSGRRPGGGKDPFGLRRAAQGVLRIILEHDVDIELPPLLELACAVQPAAVTGGEDPATQIYDFILERLRAWYGSEAGLSPEVFEAVRVKRPASLKDLDERVQAVAGFLEHDAAPSLAAANKRIANILRQAGRDSFGEVKTDVFTVEAEHRLYEALLSAKREIAPMLQGRAYREALTVLSGLRETVDLYFDQVMVMSEEPELRRNRLATLAALRSLFLDIADISRLSMG